MATEQKYLPYELLVSYLIDDFSITEIQDTDIPIFLAVAIPCHGSASGVKRRLPSGRGVTRTQAIVSAAAEAIELKALLARPGQLPLEVFSEGDAEHFCLAAGLGKAKPLRVPAQEVILDYAAITGEPFTHDANTSGCAAGVDFEDALDRALLELIERDALSAWWHGQHLRRKFELHDVLKSHPRLVAFCETRQRITTILDLATDIRVPVLASVSWEPSGGAIAIGCCAHPDLEAAAEASFTEMLQTEVAMQLAGTENPELNSWNMEMNAKTLAHLHGGDMGKESKMERNNLDARQALAKAGFSAYYCDFSQPDMPLSVVRAIIPGLSGLGSSRSADRIHLLRQSQGWQTTLLPGDDLEAGDPY